MKAQGKFMTTVMYAGRALLLVPLLAMMVSFIVAPNYLSFWETVLPFTFMLGFLLMHPPSFGDSESAGFLRPLWLLALVGVLIAFTATRWDWGLYVFLAYGVGRVLASRWARG